MIFVVDVFLDHFVEFASIAKLQSNFTVLVLPQVFVDLESKVDHLLANFDADEHVVVVENFWEKLGGAHAYLDNGHFVVVFLDID